MRGKTINLQIKYQCPQCGAPAVLDETDRIFLCEFCRVKSYLLCKNYFRYILPAKEGLNKDFFYLPFWRFKGTLFSCVQNTVKHRFMDLSYQAVQSKFFPVSVGFRSQALKLSFITDDTVGQFLEPAFPLDNALSIFKKRFNSRLPKPIYHQVHIGETLSLIYSPFYLQNNKLYDGITDRAVTSVLPDDFDINSFKKKKPGGSIKFISTLCPKCGWDLTGKKDTLVLHCRNCESVFKASGEKLTEFDFAHLSGDKQTAVYLPFWQIRADVSGMELNTYADLIKIANLPMAIFDIHRKTEFKFWCPAFKIQHKTFLRIKSQITISQPSQEQIPGLPAKSIEIESVTLPVSEAFQSIKIGIADFVKPKRMYYSKLKDMKIDPVAFKLIYIPFRKGHHELINPELKLAINKNLMRLSVNL